MAPKHEAPLPQRQGPSWRDPIPPPPVPIAPMPPVPPATPRRQLVVLRPPHQPPQPAPPLQLVNLRLWPQPLPPYPGERVTPRLPWGEPRPPGVLSPRMMTWIDNAQLPPLPASVGSGLTQPQQSLPPLEEQVQVHGALPPRVRMPQPGLPRPGQRMPLVLRPPPMPLPGSSQPRGQWQQMNQPQPHSGRMPRD